MLLSVVEKLCKFNGSDRAGRLIMAKPSIVFIGASSFGLKCLERILERGECEVVGVITAPQKFKISYSKDSVTNYLYADFTEFCETREIPCITTETGMRDSCLLGKVESWNPKLFLVVGWYYMLPASWMALAPAYGLHASLLPAYSGGAPLVWSMINGENETGITFFKFADGVDNGDIVAQKRTRVDYKDTIATLYARVEFLGMQLIDENLNLLSKGLAQLTAQNELKRTIFPQRSPKDGEIDWEQNSRKIYDFVRAQTKPYPGAFTRCKTGGIIRVWAVEEILPSVQSRAPGTFYMDDNTQLFVSCKGGDLRVLDWQLENTAGEVISKDARYVVQ